MGPPPPPIDTRAGSKRAPQGRDRGKPASAASPVSLRKSATYTEQRAGSTSASAARSATLRNARRERQRAARNANEKSLREMNAEEAAGWVRQVLAQEDSPSVQECVEEVVQAFRANMVSGVDVLELTSEDMREELGIRTLRVRKALNHAIRADRSGGA